MTTRNERALAAGGTGSAAAAVVCMGFMATAGSTGVAGGAGMAAMSGSAAGVGAAPITTRFLTWLGLGSLTRLPDAVLRPVFIGLLVVSVASAFLTFRRSRRIVPLVLTATSAIVLYGSIYVVMSEPAYYLGLGGMLVAAAYGIAGSVVRRLRRPHSAPTTA